MMTQNSSSSINSDLPTELAKPARRALEGAGFFQLEQITKLSEEEILKLHGMGPKALEQIRVALNVKGLSFSTGRRSN
jgi:DNA-directed RNA polymerase alpha subunit